MLLEFTLAADAMSEMYMTAKKSKKSKKNKKDKSKCKPKRK